MAARPTMKDVARAAGVSLMTVSRVVAGETGVAPQTAARVEEAIRALGYQRNDIARVTLQFAQPIAFDAYQDYRSTGAFILIDEHTNATVAAGMIAA